MSSGSVQSVIVCAPAAEALSPCPAGTAPTVVQAYLVHPDSANLFDAAIGPYDYTNASQYFAASFVFVFSLYLGARVFGMLIDMVRRD